jgi:hypothetical protein
MAWAVYPITVPVLERTIPKDTALYLRTIIVIADIDRGLHSPAVHINTYDPPCLTFRHWSGVTPYTSTYVFAGSCVFDKQSPGNLSLRPQHPKVQGRPYPEVTAAFLPSSLRTSHSFALVYSTLPPVSVYGTEPLRLTLEVFLGSVLPRFAWPKPHIQTQLGVMHDGFAYHASSKLQHQSNEML